MAQINGCPSLKFSFTLELDEEEAKALEALTKYGTDEFIRFFYERLGRECLQKYEPGLRRLFSVAKQQLPPWFKKIEDFRKMI